MKLSFVVLFKDAAALCLPVNQREEAPRDRRQEQHSLGSDVYEKHTETHKMNVFTSHTHAHTSDLKVE